MKRKFFIELNLPDSIKKMTGFEIITKNANVQTYPLEDYFTDEGVQDIIAKLYYFLFHYYAYTKIKIDINDISFYIKGDLTRSSDKVQSVGIQIFVIHQKKKIVVIKNQDGSLDKLIKNEIDKKISNTNSLSFTSLTPINFEKEIKGKIRLFGKEHPINKSSSELIPILRDLSKINTTKKLNTELSFMLDSRTAKIIIILFVSYDKDIGRNALVFFELIQKKEEWMRIIYFSNIYNIKELFTLEDFVNPENYGIIIDNLKLVGY